MTFSYKFFGLEPDITGGVHIHTGTTCSDASLVGGHYWDDQGGTVADPWTNDNGSVYTTNSDGKAVGSFTLDSGYGFDDNKGHAFVIHASDGSRVGCGLLETSKPGVCVPTSKLTACVSSYPDSDSSVSGKIVVSVDTSTEDLTYNYYLENLEESAIGGTHIHTGTTCADASLVGGHYWDDQGGTVADPWVNDNGAVYSTNQDGIASGNFVVNSGYGHTENVGHAVVVHASDGSRVGCGVLKGGEKVCD